MNTVNLKSLNEAVLSVVTPNKKTNVGKEFVNSLTAKANHIHEAEEKKEDEKNESPFHEKKEGSDHEKDEMVRKLAVKALKRAKKKARAVKETIELAEKAAPGYEDWASDPKVKASFKKRYGNRWKQVMYGHSWNMKKMNEETELAEGFQAKRLRVIRKEIGKREPTTGAKAEFLKTTYKKKLARAKAIAAKYPEMSKKYGGGQQGDMMTRSALRNKAMKAKGISEETIVEALQAKLNRTKGKAYRLGYSITGNTNAHAKAMRRAAELEDKVAAMKARRGGASPEAVKAAGNIRGKSGVPTQKGMRLADRRNKAIRTFRSEAGIMADMGKRMTPDERAEKRKSQQYMADFRNKARSGDFGQDNQAALRARYNYQKRYGRLKGK